MSAYAYLEFAMGAMGARAWASLWLVCACAPAGRGAVSAHGHLQPLLRLRGGAGEQGMGSRGRGKEAGGVPTGGVLCRVKKGGTHFEVLCHAAQVEKFREGKAA